MANLLGMRNYGDEIEYERDKKILRIRLSQYGRRNISSAPYVFGFFSISSLVFFIILFMAKSMTIVAIGMFSLFIIAGVLALFLLILLSKSEWLGAEFVVSESNIEKRMPSGKTVCGSWENLIRVELSRQRLHFRDGTVLAISYYLFAAPGHDAWDKIIAKAPKSSLLNIEWKDWCAFKDDTSLINYARLSLLIIGLVIYPVLSSYFEINKETILSILFFCVVLFALSLFIRPVVFRYREFRGDYSLKE